MPTSAASGLQQAAHAASAARRRALRRRGSVSCGAQSSQALPQELLEDDRGARAGIEVARRRARLRARSSCSARRPRAPAGRSGLRAGARSAARARVLSCAAPSGWTGTPTTSASGCHSAISCADRVEARVAVGGDGASADRALPVSVLPIGDADAPRAEIERETNGARRAVRRSDGNAHACPPSSDSMRGSMPSSDSASS